MPVDLAIVESTTELGQTVVEVILQSSSEPGPQGPPGAGGVIDADYLVGTAHAGLTDEIVVGTAPGGELGGTWASPTVDATHSGSSHAAVQAAAEATAQAALDAHLSDATDVHDASAISIADAANDFTATEVEGALAELQADAEADATALSDHIADASAAHAASAISFSPGGMISATDVQAAIEEVATEAGSGGAPTDVNYLVGTASGGLSAEIVVGTSPGGELGGTWASPTVDATHSGSSHAGVQAAAEATAQAALDAHTGDATAAHAGSAISVSSATLSGTGTDVQAVFEEIDNLLDDHSARHEDNGADEISIQGLAGTPVELTNHLNDTSAAHAASAISADSTTLVGTGTDVQAVLEELDNGIADHLADSSAAHAASAISVADSGGYFAGTDAEAITQVLGQKLVDGWVDDSANAWTRTANTTFTVSGDRTAVFSKGTRIKVTDTTTKYFVVVASSHSAGTTTVTITGGADYSLAATPTAQFYSYEINPQGFPFWFTHAPTYVGFSADPSGGVSRFSIVGKVCHYVHNRNTGTSNGTSFTLTLPVAAANVQSTSVALPFFILFTNNSAAGTVPGRATIVDGSNVLTLSTTVVGGTWTGSGSKSAYFSMQYEF